MPQTRSETKRSNNFNLLQNEVSKRYCCKGLKLKRRWTPLIGRNSWIPKPTERRSKVQSTASDWQKRNSKKDPAVVNAPRVFVVSSNKISNRSALNLIKARKCVKRQRPAVTGNNNASRSRKCSLDHDMAVKEERLLEEKKCLLLQQEIMEAELKALDELLYLQDQEMFELLYDVPDIE